MEAWTRLGADVVDSLDDLCHGRVVEAHAAMSLQALVNAEPLRIGRQASTLQDYGLEITVLSLFKHPTAKEITCRLV